MKKVFLDFLTALFWAAVIVLVVLFSTSDFAEFIYSNF